MKQRNIFLHSKHKAQKTFWKKRCNKNNFEQLPSSQSKFGGTLLNGKRKTQRPIAINKPLHLIVKSEKTNEQIFFSPKDRQLNTLIKKSAERYNIRIYKFSVNWSHFHFVIKVLSRKDYVNFVRYLGAQVVAYFSKMLKRNIKGLFRLRPFTRIVNWGKDFRKMCKYITTNIAESLWGSIDELSLYPEAYWRAGPSSLRTNENFSFQL